MKLSRETHRKFENFLREYFADESLVLPEIQIYCRRGSRVFTKILTVDGITFGRHIFIKPKYLRRDENNRRWRKGICSRTNRRTRFSIADTAQSDFFTLI
jgi:hypothetical protein